MPPFAARIIQYFRLPLPEQEQDPNRALLQQAVFDAFLMVSIAAEKAIPLAPDDITIIIRLKNSLHAAAIPAETEAAFWSAYERITRAFKPISIASIRATSPPLEGQSRTGRRRFCLWPRVSLSTRCANTYKLLSLVTLLALILVQVYWYIGWSLTSDIRAQRQTIAAYDKERAGIALSLDGNPQEQNRFSLEQRNRVQTLDSLITEHQNWKMAAENHLQNWNQVWSNMDLLTLQPWQNDDYRNYPPEVQRRIQFVSAENTLQAISEYALPILYGLIGACFYILRQIPKEIEALTFSMNSYIGYSLRMVQGPLAGIMTSYFFSSDPIEPSGLVSSGQNGPALEPGLTALSPLAVAFLAGYSVEFVFRFFDKLLFSSDTPGQTTQNSPNTHPPTPGAGNSTKPD
ncbi:hypothetical protein [Sneathiella chinensis]|uniref:Uncharacterized protein n=1 Tax=Sneathiella chinensis TaxID=349750 RepID=A0ABQ5U6V2_9PROT|nr:hypothetical protein [Sneathiella chinensis]GLQ07430.1 hypothetical protein GCM10007924_26510 [Sneathiella chinensis]